MMKFGYGKKDYDEVVKSNNKLRAEMEKMRLQNALLQDQIRALSTLPPELSPLYVFVQLKMSVSIDDVKASPKFADLDETEITGRAEALVQRNLFEKTEKDGKTYYSINTPDMSESWVPKPEETIRSAYIPQIDEKKSSLDEF